MQRVYWSTGESTGLVGSAMNANFTALGPRPQHILGLNLNYEHLQQKSTKKNLPTLNKFVCRMTSGALLVRGEKHLSQIHKKNISEQLTKKIGTAPAYQTRIRDNVYVPDKPLFMLHIKF